MREVTTPTLDPTILAMTRAHYESMTRVDIHPLTPWCKWVDLPECAVVEKYRNMCAAVVVILTLTHDLDHIYRAALTVVHP